MAGMKFLYAGVSTMTLFLITMSSVVNNCVVFSRDKNRSQQYYESMTPLFMTNCKRGLLKLSTTLLTRQGWHTIFLIMQLHVGTRRQHKWGLSTMPLLNLLVPHSTTAFMLVLNSIRGFLRYYWDFKFGLVADIGKAFLMISVAMPWDSCGWKIHFKRNHTS